MKKFLFTAALIGMTGLFAQPAFAGNGGKGGCKSKDCTCTGNCKDDKCTMKCCKGDDKSCKKGDKNCSKDCKKDNTSSSTSSDKK